MGERKIVMIGGRRSGKTATLLEYMLKERLTAELEEIKIDIAKNSSYHIDGSRYINTESVLRLIDEHIEEILE